MRCSKWQFVPELSTPFCSAATTRAYVLRQTYRQCPNGRLVLAFGRIVYSILKLSQPRGGELVIEGADDEKAYVL